jgi:prohibitin 1
MRVLFRPVEQKLAEILNSIGADYDQRILPSVGNEVLKSTVA